MVHFHVIPGSRLPMGRQTGSAAGAHGSAVPGKNTFYRRFPGLLSCLGAEKTPTQEDVKPQVGCFKRLGPFLECQDSSCAPDLVSDDCTCSALEQ